MGLEDVLIIGALGLGAYALIKKRVGSSNATAPVPGQPVTVTVRRQSLPQDRISLGNPLDLLARDYGASPPLTSVPVPSPNPALSVPLSRGTVTGMIKAADSSFGILSADGALELIKAGQPSVAKSKKMSQYYTWADFFKTENPNEAELSAMQAGVRLAFVLDVLCNRMGRKIGVNSWYRTRAHQIRVYAPKPAPLASRHIVGDGADITAGTDKLALYRVARSIPEIRRIGYPMNGSGFLHLDLMSSAPAGQQQIFVDNNTVQSNFRNVAVLKSGNSAAYGT